jgi:hypothetical protein
MGNPEPDNAEGAQEAQPRIEVYFIPLPDPMPMPKNLTMLFGTMIVTLRTSQGSVEIRLGLLICSLLLQARWTWPCDCGWSLVTPSLT